MRRYRPSLTISIMAFLGFLLVLTWSLFSLLAFKTATNDLYSQKGEHARAFLAAFVSQLPETIPTYPDGIIAPNSSAALYAFNLSDESSFGCLTLVDRNGKAIFSYGCPAGDVYLPFKGLPQNALGSYVLGKGKEITHVMDVIRGGASVARAGLVMPLDPENARINRTRQMLVTYFILDFFVLLALGAFILSKIVVKPINRLLLATEKITGGNYGQRLTVTGSAELAQLADAFNGMSAALLHKSQQVAEQMAALEQANDDLLEAREQALRSEKMASIGLLAAGTAHEIGTPLAAIMGYAELLTGEGEDEGVVGDYVRRISQECGRIDRIVRGLLDYSRPRANVIEMFDVPRVVSETLELLDQQGAFKKLRVTTYFATEPLWALADEHQLQQVLINLLLNSRDAVPEGGKISIRVTNRVFHGFDGATEYVLIDVVDNGTGIPPEHLERLFYPFFTTKPPGKGTGLGLAIAARIMEDFGGKITVESMVGRGSRFTLWLKSVCQS